MDRRSGRLERAGVDARFSAVDGTLRRPPSGVSAAGRRHVPCRLGRGAPLFGGLGFFVIHAGSISILPGAMECVRAGYIPGGLKNNRDFAECLVEYESPISDEVKALLFDPQTAGGLLVSIAADDSDPLLRELQNAGVPARRIGEVVESAKPSIRIY